LFKTPFNLTLDTTREGAAKTSMGIFHSFSSQANEKKRTRSHLVVHALQNFQVWVIDTAIIIQALKECQKVNLREPAATDCAKNYG